MFKAPDSPKTSSEPNVPRPQEPKIDKMDAEDEEMFKQIGSKQLGKVMVSIYDKYGGHGCLYSDYRVAPREARSEVRKILIFERLLVKM